MAVPLARTAAMVTAVVLGVLLLPPARLSAAATGLDVEVHPDGPWTAGIEGTVIVTATNTDGSVATDYAGQVTIRRHVPPTPGTEPKPTPLPHPGLGNAMRAAGDTYPAPYAYTAADGGSHAFGVTLTSAGDMSLEAVGVDGGHVVTRVISLVVVAGPPARVEFVAEDPWRPHWDGQAYVGQSFDFQPIVRVTDAFGNAPRPVKVTLSLATGAQERLSCGDGMTRTTALGVAAFYGCGIQTAGGYRLAASVPGLESAVGAPFTVAATAPVGRHRPSLRPPSVDVVYHANDDLALTATVSNDDQWARSIRLFSLAPGAVVWDFVTQEIVDERSLDITIPLPEVNTLLQVCDLGSAIEDEPAVCGTVVPVKVRQRVTMTPGPASGDGVRHAGPGSRQTFKVDVDPLGAPGVLKTVVLQVSGQQDGHWVVRTRKTAPTYAAPVAFTIVWAKGQWRVRAIAASTAYNTPGASGFVRFSVP